MSPVNLHDLKRTFFLCGYLSAHSDPQLRERLAGYGVPLVFHETDGGSFFYSQPGYSDVFEDQEMVWIKLGVAHQAGRRLTTGEMAAGGMLSVDGVSQAAFQGGASLIGFLKNEARGYVYRSLLSTAGLRYWRSGDDLLVSDNLRLLAHFLTACSLDDQALVQHHIYRKVFGQGTYLREVNNLLGGELITWEPGEFQIELRDNIDSCRAPQPGKAVDSESGEWFFQVISDVVGVYLQGHENQAGMMLSGGIDSSTLQAAINQQPGIDSPFPSFSFVVDAPGFEYEMENARQAVQLLGTEHTFLEISPEKYRDWLIDSISILGQPIQFDAPPSYYALAGHLAAHKPGIKYLFNGEPADDLLGDSLALQVVQGDRYKNWPIWLLKLAAAVLGPVSQSKAYGARKAADTLLQCREPFSRSNFINQSNTCDWDLVESIFSPQDLQPVFELNQELVARYSSTQMMVEQIHVFNYVSHGMNIPSLTRQLGLFCGREIYFPISDDAILQAAFTFDPLERYTYNHRIKPLMKMALESQLAMPVIQRPKGYSSVFKQAVVPWMREGVLRELVRDIERPAYLSQPVFQAALEQPDWFTWNLLTIDLFQKYGLKQGAA